MIFMIEIKLIDECGFETAITGMRASHRSYDKSDSRFIDDWGSRDYDNIGVADEMLMCNLARSGSSHAKYRRMLVVYLDILAPLYWWKEFDTYKVGTVTLSESTMHSICDKEFEPDDFSHEHTGILDIREFAFSSPFEFIDTNNHLHGTIQRLNLYRNGYLWYKDKDPEIAKRFWWQIIQQLPSSYNQRRFEMLNYEVLANIYKDRKNHRLDEWREFCKWIESLPCAEVMTGGDKDV